MQNKTIMVYNLIPTYWQNFKCLIMSTVGQKVEYQELLHSWWVWIKTTMLANNLAIFCNVEGPHNFNIRSNGRPSISPSLLPEQSEANLLYLC